MDSWAAEDERILTRWAQDDIRKGEVDRIVDSSLRKEISPDSLKTFVGVAERCLCDEPKNRPKMSEVALQLEFVLEQQESKQIVVPNEVASVSDDIHHRNDETDLSVKKGKPTMTSPDMQNLTPPKEQTNSNVVRAELPSRRKDGKGATTHKPSRLWPWDGLWNRVKPSKKNELLLSEICEADMKLTKFDWNTIVAATNQFSYSNKVGEGGFGPVYKAVLPTGQVVAVKRFSPSSEQGLEEFKNGIDLLPNLQHRNIIKLLGYCIHRKEKLLVHEFMENISLDTFILTAHGQLLEWPVRFKIIMGIARGLVYLHQDLGLRIIHRDPKPYNILLDSEMNPKISDFGLARILAEHQFESGSTLVCGTVAIWPRSTFTIGNFQLNHMCKDSEL